MFDKIKFTLKDPKFQRNAAQAAGGVVSIIATAVISNLVSVVVSKGIDLAMDKIQGVTTPTE